MSANTRLALGAAVCVAVIVVVYFGMQRGGTGGGRVSGCPSS